MTTDAFIHLPDQRSRVTQPEQSLLRLTPEMFAMWESRARAAGLPASWRLSDEVIEASRLAVLGGHPGGNDLWIPNDSHTDTGGSIALAHALVDAVRPSAWEAGLRAGPRVDWITAHRCRAFELRLREPG